MSWLIMLEAICALDFVGVISDGSFRYASVRCGLFFLLLLLFVLLLSLSLPSWSSEVLRLVSALCPLNLHLLFSSSAPATKFLL